MGASGSLLREARHLIVGRDYVRYEDHVSSLEGMNGSAESRGKGRSPLYKTATAASPALRGGTARGSRRESRPSAEAKRTRTGHRPPKQRPLAIQTAIPPVVMIIAGDRGMDPEVANGPECRAPPRPAGGASIGSASSRSSSETGAATRSGSAATAGRPLGMIRSSARAIATSAGRTAGERDVEHGQRHGKARGRRLTNARRPSACRRWRPSRREIAEHPRGRGGIRCGEARGGTPPGA